MDGTRKYAWTSGHPQGCPDFFCAPQKRRRQKISGSRQVPGGLGISHHFRKDRTATGPADSVEPLFCTSRHYTGTLYARGKPAFRLPVRLGGKEPQLPESADMSRAFPDAEYQRIQVPAIHSWIDGEEGCQFKKETAQSFARPCRHHTLGRLEVSSMKQAICKAHG